MSIDCSSVTADEEKSREQLTQELSKLRAELKSEQIRCQQQSEEITRLKSTNRKGSEDSLRQRTAVLEGINRIFQETLTCRTEEELGSLCLAVAEEITSSRFGFIGEISAEGRLDDIAISNPGWKACRMANPIGHRLVPTGFEIYGLYGRVLRDGKGFYTNNPDSHPDCIGVPEGHPPLQSFFGVPLIHAGETIGMIGLANRPGGYGDTDLKALEMLAPAVVQALLSKRTEAALRLREAQFRDVFTHAPVGMAVMDLEGRFFYVNKAYCRITGYDKQELIQTGFNFQKLTHPDDLDGNLENVHRMLAETIPAFFVEMRFIRKDGTIVWVRSSTSLRRDGAGRPTQTVSLVEDIDERRQAEAELQQSEERLKRSQEIAHLGSWELDFQKNELSWSDEVYRIFGFQPQQFKATCEAFFASVHPDDRKMVDDAYSDSLHDNHDSYEVEHRIVRPNGEIRYVHEKCEHHQNGSGRIIRSAGMVHDITDRRRAEQAVQKSETRYRNLFENMTEEVHFWKVIRDAAGRIKTWRLVDANPPTLKTWGKNSVEEIKDKTTDEIFGPGATDHYMPVVQKIMTEGVPYLFEDYFPHLDKHFRFSSVPMGDYFITTGADITAIKKVQEALWQLNETLEQKVAERTELAEARSKQLQSLAVELIEAEDRERWRISQILHDDLQQLLAGARMQLQTAHQELSFMPVLANVERLLKESIEKSRRLSHELSPAVVHHSGLVAALEWLIRQMAEQFGLEIELKTDCPPQFESTPLKTFVFRAVQELLFNVFKHAGVKDARVMLTASEGSLQVTVDDHGEGFDLDILNSSSAKVGLGLISLRERARFIGGSLEIESAPKRGSHFTLTVPLELKTAKVKQPEFAAADLQPVTPAESADSVDKLNIRVLLADDHKVMRQGLISMIAGQPNIEVVGEASNGLEALDLVSRLLPDVVVMDVTMPGMNGMAATRLIKAELPEVRVIGLSMFEDEEIGRTMRRAGAEAFISKTSSTGELLKAIYGMAVKP